MPADPLWLEVNWPAPPHIRALVTLRQGGFSFRDYSSFNLATHVGDDPQWVLANRQLLKDKARIPAEPYWLTQIHGTEVVEASPQPEALPPKADASIAFQAATVCCVLTADCLPLLITDIHGSRVAAIHAGWRGLAAGIIEKTIQSLESSAETLLVWLGPAIGPVQFEVGEEVYRAFVDEDGTAAVAFQLSTKPKTWLADIYRLAALRLQRLGVVKIYGGGYCTYSDRERFYSYRRDKTTGRMASLIWINEAL